MKRNHTSDSRSQTCGRCKSIAYARVVLPDGTQVKREVVVFDKAGNPLSHHPLTEEEPFTEWRDETYLAPLHRE